jgi:hypothetical protein
MLIAASLVKQERSERFADTRKIETRIDFDFGRAYRRETYEARVSSVAQTYTGRILGEVTDASGAAVKGAKITITNVETGAVRNLESSDTGDYLAANLPPGLYNIVAQAQGFKRVERAAVRLEVAKDLRIDVAMEAGNITEQITVSNEPPAIDTTTTTLGGTFSNKAINDLPLNGRDFQNLVVLRPGVQRATGGGFLSISSSKEKRGAAVHTDAPLFFFADWR